MRGEVKGMLRNWKPVWLDARRGNGSRVGNEGMGALG